MVDGRPYYVNTTGEAKDVAIAGTMTGLISGKQWTGTLRLEPLGADLLQK
jgi:beta-galactosidase